MALFNRKPKTDLQFSDTTAGQLHSSLVPAAGPVNDGGGPGTDPSYVGFPTYSGFPGGGITYGGFPGGDVTYGGFPPPSYIGFPTTTGGSSDPASSSSGQSDVVDRYVYNQKDTQPAPIASGPGIPTPDTSGGYRSSAFVPAGTYGALVNPTPADSNPTPGGHGQAPPPTAEAHNHGDSAPVAPPPTQPILSGNQLDKEGHLFEQSEHLTTVSPQKNSPVESSGSANPAPTHSVLNPAATEISYGSHAKPITVISDNGSEIGGNSTGTTELIIKSNPTEPSVQKGINAFEQEEGHQAAPNTSVPQAAGVDTSVQQQAAVHYAGVVQTHSQDMGATTVDAQIQTANLRTADIANKVNDSMATPLSSSSAPSDAVNRFMENHTAPTVTPPTAAPSPPEPTPVITLPGSTDPNMNAVNLGALSPSAAADYIVRPGKIGME